MSEGPDPHTPTPRTPFDSPADVLDPGSDGAVGQADSTDLDDATLLRAHVDGGPTAFGVLVSRHRDRMWAVAMRTMRNPDDAADALQDAYISAFRRAATFRGDAQVTSWLHRIVVNACLDRLRSQKLRAADPLPADLDRTGHLGTTEETDPLEEQERRGVVADALGRLNPDQRAALVLVDMEGYPVDEAARILGCAPGTIKSRCARGRARLLPLLAAYERTGGG